VVIATKIGISDASPTSPGRIHANTKKRHRAGSHGNPCASDLPQAQAAYRCPGEAGGPEEGGEAPPPDYPGPYPDPEIPAFEGDPE
jgi:hypothetical protein